MVFVLSVMVALFNRPAEIGDSVVIAAQSIGEPNTAYSTYFPRWGTASNIADENSIVAKFDGKIKFDELRTLKTESEDSKGKELIIIRSGEFRIIDEATGVVLMTQNVPYGAELLSKKRGKIKKEIRFVLGIHITR